MEMMMMISGRLLSFFGLLISDQLSGAEMKKRVKRGVTDVSTDLFPESDAAKLPLIVESEVYVDDVNSFNAVTMDFRLDFFLKHKWGISEEICTDYEQLLNEYNMKLEEEPDNLTVPPAYTEYFWTPDTYLANSKSVQTPSKETPTTVLMITRLKDKTCKLEYTLRLAAIVACQMDFHQYPRDIQVCPLCMRSFAFPSSMVRYRWIAEMDHPPMNPELKLLRHHMYLTKSTRFRDMLDVNYSMVVVNFIFERDINHHLIHVYAPSILIILLSWFNFWMGTDLIPGRITLCVTSLLALTTQFSGARQGLPPVAYVNGLDIWMVSCMTMVIASLLVITMVKMMDKRQKDREEEEKKEEEEKEKEISVKPKKNVLIRRMDLEKGYKNFRKHKIRSFERIPCRHVWPYGIPIDDDEDDFVKKKPKNINWVAVIDGTARIVFPLVFAIFNAVYWPLLMNRAL